MKNKPSEDEMAFLTGATTETPIHGLVPDDGDRIPVYQIRPKTTVQKAFRLQWDTAAALKALAAEESARQGRKITETEIVERLLRRHMKMKVD